MNEVTLFFSTIAPYAITGAIVSIFVQYTKDFLNKSTHKFFYVIGASILIGIIAKFANLIPGEWFTAISGVWASANSAYLFFSQFSGSTSQTTTTT